MGASRCNPVEWKRNEPTIGATPGVVPFDDPGVDKQGPLLLGDSLTFLLVTESALSGKLVRSKKSRKISLR